MSSSIQPSVTWLSCTRHDGKVYCVICKPHDHFSAFIPLNSSQWATVFISFTHSLLLAFILGLWFSPDFAILICKFSCKSFVSPPGSRWNSSQRAAIHHLICFFTLLLVIPLYSHSPSQSWDLPTSYICISICLLDSSTWTSNLALQDQHLLSLI